MRFGRSTSSETDDHPSRPGRTSAGVRPGNDRTPACDSAWAASPAHRDSPGRRSRDHPVPQPRPAASVCKAPADSGYEGQRGLSDGHDRPVPGSRRVNLRPVRRGRPGPASRIHYRRYQQSEPAAHIHVHGHRGALSHLLSQTGHESPHEMASLHVPSGAPGSGPAWRTSSSSWSASAYSTQRQDGALMSMRAGNGGGFVRLRSSPVMPRKWPPGFSADSATPSRRQILYLPLRPRHCGTGNPFPVARALRCPRDVPGHPSCGNPRPILGVRPTKNKVRGYER